MFRIYFFTKGSLDFIVCPHSISLSETDDIKNISDTKGKSFLKSFAIEREYFFLVITEMNDFIKDKIKEQPRLLHWIIEKNKKNKKIYAVCSKIYQTEGE